MRQADIKAYFEQFVGDLPDLPMVTFPTLASGALPITVMLAPMSCHDKWMFCGTDAVSVNWLTEDNKPIHVIDMRSDYRMGT